MIDIANDVYDYVVKKVRIQHPNIAASSKLIAAPASLPALSIVQASNIVLQRMRTLKIENAATVMFQVEAYSDKNSGNQMEAKKILNLADEAFAEIGFTRIFYQEILNAAQPSIYRIVARYEGIVDKDLWIYQN